MKSIVNLLRTEPALVAGAAQAVLALLTATVLTHLTAAESGSILAAFSAVVTLVAAAYTRPFQVSALTGLSASVITLLVTFGVHGVEPSLVALVNALITSLAAILVRTNVTPVATLKAKAAAARM